MGEQHANGSRVSRHRLVADATIGVIANPMSGRDIRRLVASASVFPNAEKASMVVRRDGRRGSAQGGPGAGVHRHLRGSAAVQPELFTQVGAGTCSPRRRAAVTTPLGILLLAERTALLFARDDEFVAVVLMGYTSMRWGEIVGLETEFVRPKSVRVEWQLYELDTGELHRCPPKDDSYRDIDTPGFLATLLTGHIARTKPMPASATD